MKNFREISRETSDGDTINISPLIDVVFILLIFFIVSASFVKGGALSVDIPVQSASEVPSEKFLTVEVRADGAILADSLPCSPVSLATAAKNSRMSAAVVNAEKSVRAETLLAVVDTLKSAGIKTVYFAVSKK